MKALVCEHKDLLCSLGWQGYREASVRSAPDSAAGSLFPQDRPPCAIDENDFDVCNRALGRVDDPSVDDRRPSHSQGWDLHCGLSPWIQDSGQRPWEAFLDTSPDEIAMRACSTIWLKLDPACLVALSAGQLLGGLFSSADLDFDARVGHSPLVQDPDLERRGMEETVMARLGDFDSLGGLAFRGPLLSNFDGCEGPRVPEEPGQPQEENRQE